MNYFRLPFFLGSELILGPFCSLVVARYLGLKHALWFSTLVSIPLMIAWSSFIFIVYVFEAAFIAYMISIGKRNIITIIVFFWLFIGLPIAWFLTNQNPEINPAFQHAFLAKLLLNAILYSLLASIVINSLLIKTSLSKNNEPIFLTLRQKTSNHISVIFSLLMSAVLLSYFYYQVHILEQSTKNNMSLVHEKIHSEFNHKMTTFTQVFEEKKHLFAEIWNNPERIDKQLKALHQRYPEFISMLVSDKEGYILSFSFPGEINHDIESISIKDRPYFIHAMNQQKVYVSSGFVGKGFGNDHIVAISIAIVDEDTKQTLGILEGSLNLLSIQQLSASWGEHLPYLTLITDQEMKTVKANTNNYSEPLHPIEFKPSQYSLFSQQLYQVNGLESLFMIDQSNFHWGWQLTTMVNQVEIAKSLQEILAFLLMVLISSVFISQWLAWLLSKIWTNQLTKVSNRIGQFKNDLPEAEDEIPHLAAEIKVFYEEIKRSRMQYIKLNKELESKVVAQTSQLYEANQKLEKLSLTDPLTELENRRSFDRKLQLAWENEVNKRITLLLIDIDHFKKINDQYGHPIGDLVLMYLAKSLMQLDLLNTTSIARIGGEEFAIICEDISQEEAIHMTDKIFNHLTSHKQLFEKNPIKFTVSMGIAVADPTKCSIKSLYQHADNALYQAKESGRNQYSFSEI